MPKHYHVLTGLSRGYMPDDNQIFTNRKHAVSYAVERAKEFREEGFKVNGSDGNYYAHREIAQDFTIETCECQEADCLEYASL